jgi:ABC-type Fe3+ transport system permease subunit/DNA-binding beta-propeller fold protein YncE
MNWTLLTNSLLVAGAATLLSAAWGLAVALVLTASARPWRSGLIVGTLAVFALPSFLVTNCWIDLLGASGKLRSFIPFEIFSRAGAIWILALLLWPVPALATHAAWRKLEPAHFEIDSALRGFQLVKYLLWPAARPLAITAAAVVFALALNNFAVPAILQVKVFPAEVWVQYSTNLDARAALLLSWPMILGPLALLLFFRRTEFPWPRETQTDLAIVFRRQLGARWLNTARLIALMVLSLSLLVPLLQLTTAPRTWSELVPALQSGVPALTHSLLYAASAAALAVVFGWLFARVRAVAALWLLFLVPGVLLGIGAVMVFNRPGMEFFSRSGTIVVSLLVARHLALAHAISRHALLALDTDLTDSARLDGARGLTLFRHIILPQVTKPLAAAAYMVYVLSLWDVETTLLVMPAGGETLALRIFNLLHYGHNAHVNALCLILLLLALAPLLAFALWRVVRARLAILMGVLAIGLVGCGQPTTSNQNATSIRSSIFSHVEIIGRRGTGAGEFNKPRSLTCDTNDNLYVADMTGRIQKFSPEGKFLLSWQMPQTDLGKPKGMSCDREGNIVVLEPHYQRVNHFTPDGKLVRQWGVKGTNAGELTLPRAIVVDTKGDVIVSEYTLVDRVQKFTPRGEHVLAVWGTPGLAPGEFNRAEGVGVDAGDNIYVADSCNHRIQIFSPKGKLLRTHGRAGERTAEFSYPYDIAVDEQGRQFVCEFGNSRIQVFDRHDRPVERIGKAGGEPGEFANPWSVALDTQGNLYVADSQNHRVQKLVRKVEGRASKVESEQGATNVRAQMTFETPIRLSTLDPRPSTAQQ